MYNFFNWIRKVYKEVNMNKITINGETTYVSGNRIQVRNNSIIVDGVLIKGDLVGEVTVKFEGDLASLDATHATVHGNVLGDVDTTHITVNGYVGGNIDSTHVKCGEVKGNIDATHITHK